MNRERRKVIANVFGDAAKYTLTIGTIGSIITQKLTLSGGLAFGVMFVAFLLLTYFVMPKDNGEVKT